MISYIQPYMIGCKGPELRSALYSRQNPLPQALSPQAPADRVPVPLSARSPAGPSPPPAREGASGGAAPSGAEPGRAAAEPSPAEPSGTMMAQRALPNPYADYDKSLATSYFDAAGRVSGAGARRLRGSAPAVHSRDLSG